MDRQQINIPWIKRLRYSLIIGGLIALVLVGVWWLGLFHSIRLRTYSVYYAPQPTTGQVAIIALDNESLAAYGRIAEWPRTLHAQLVDVLAEGQARVIVFDVLFADPSRDAAADEALNEAIRRARFESANRTRTVMPIAGERQLPTTHPARVTYAQFVRPIPTIGQYVDYYGFVNVAPDVDGVLRWQPMQASAGQVTPDNPADVQLPLAAMGYLAYFRTPSAAIPQLVDYQPGQLRLTPRRTVPVDARGRLLINYFGHPPLDTSFPVYSFRNVVEGEVDPAVFHDKIVLVGAMGATGLTDIYPVPLLSLQGEQMAGVAVHANILETLLQGRFIARQTPQMQALFIVVFSLLAMVIYTQIKWRWMLLVVPLVLFSWGLGSLVHFNLTHEMWNLFDTALALLLPIPASLALNVYLETQRREWAEFLLESAVKASAQQLRIQQVLGSVAADATHILPGASITLYLWDENATRLKRAYPETDDTQPETSAVQPLAQRALANRRILYRDGQVAVPLIWQDTPQGVLLAKEAHDQPGRWNWLRAAGRPRSPVRIQANRRLQILELFAWQTASIIANATLYSETEALSNLKTTMLRMASHDLRNPIGSILNNAELLIDEHESEPFLDEDQFLYVNNILKSTEHMIILVEDILSLDRIRSGHLQKVPFKLNDLLHAVLDSFQGQIDRKTQHLTRTIPETFPTATGDRGQIREAISNLVSNAIKYTPEDGKITVKLSHQATTACISVTDTGYGIAPEDQVELFQEFYRADATRHIEGTGLGLSLVKTIVEAHDGRVWVESELGQGATFFMELPILITVE